MSYSVYTVFKNEDEKNKMLDFLKKEFKTLKELIKDSPIKKFQIDGNLPTDNVSYDSHNCYIGFDYNIAISEEEKSYLFSICFWLSIMAGERINFGKYENKPYIVYDGVEEWAIFVNEKGDNQFDFVETNEFGYRKIPQLRIYENRETKLLDFTMKKYYKEMKIIDEIIHTELKRLTKKWNNN